MPHPHKTRRAGIYLTTWLLLSCAWVLSACAQAPQAAPVAVEQLAAKVPARKVQTLEELMRKLKRGWDERRLNDPGFYAQELGYPVERPETFRVYGARDSYRVIRFDEGELVRMRMEVHPMVLNDGRRALVMNSIVGAAMPSCLKAEVLFGIWGRKKPTMPEAWGAHGAPMNWRYDHANGAYGKASLFIDKQTGCLSEFEISQYLK